MNVLKLVKPIKDRVVPEGTAFRRVRAGVARGFELPVDLREDLWRIVGLYEPELVSHVRGAVAPGDVCYDLGAADGYYTMGLAGMASGGTVVAVEPDAQRRASLVDTIAHNEPLPATVKVSDLVIGDVHDPETGRATLDGLVQEEGHPVPDVLKIDIEGAEGAALRGAKEVLATHGPRLIVEVHDADQRAACRAVLEHAGYDLDVVEQSTSWFRDSQGRNMERGWFVARAQTPRDSVPAKAGDPRDASAGDVRDQLCSEDEGVVASASSSSPSSPPSSRSSST